MKRYVVLGLASLLLAFGASGSASAFQLRIGNSDSPGGNVQNLRTPGQAVTATAQSCSSFGSDLPSNLTGTNPTFLTCFAFNNITGEAITKLSFSFTVPNTNPASPLVGQTIDCSAGTWLSTASCPNPKNGMVAGTTYTLEFSGTGTFAVPKNTDFYVGIDQNLADLPPFSVTPNPVPEPGELGLFGLGLFAIVVAVGWRRRKQHTGLTEAESEIG